MPNPIRPLRKTDRLTFKQKAQILSLRKKGVKTFSVYRRKGNNNKLSVHNPYTDVVRKAKLGVVGNTTRYPHAYDTEKQRKFTVKARTRVNVKGARKVRSKPFLKSILYP